jgi:hypothetical protein
LTNETKSADTDVAVTGQCEYVLVPRVPTKAMLADGWYGAHDEDAASTWSLMIEAWERSIAEETDPSKVSPARECESE